MKVPMNRRQFVAGTTAASAVALSTCALAAKANNTPLLIDTHLHCFAGANDPRFPYHPRAPYRPEQAATPQHLLRCMDQAGVSHAIVVHPEPYQDDHRYLEHCLQVGQGRLKGTLLVFADRPDFVERLPDLVKRVDAVAVRIHAYAPDRLPPFGKPELRQLWKLAANLGLAVQLHFEPRYAPRLEPLIKEFRDTRVIIDHLGRPFQGTPSEHEVVVRWSRFENTIMKLSSLPKASSYPHRNIRPIVKQLTNSYGAERMIYGGGFNSTATGESYRRAFARADEILDHLSAAERAQILGRTALRLFGFPE